MSTSSPALHPLRLFSLTLAACTALAAPLWIATPAAQSGEIVLFPSDVSVISGNWARLVSTTGAGGLKMTSEDRGWAGSSPLANPGDYFEAEFDAQAGVTYRL